MAIRNIRTIGDPILEKVCKEVKEMTPRTRELIDDMFETMYEANGVGLAAPQVGVLKRIVVIDVTGEDPIVLINPRIMETSGEQTGGEGCLSVPGKSGVVTRPNYVKVKPWALARRVKAWNTLRLSSGLMPLPVSATSMWKKWRASWQMWKVRRHEKKL